MAEPRSDSSAAALVAGHPGAIAAGRLAPLLPRMLLDEVPHAPGRGARPQPLPLLPAQERDGVGRERRDGPERRDCGSGEPLTVRGRLADPTAWMAGREVTGPLDADAAPLPEPAPWP